MKSFSVAVLILPAILLLLPVAPPIELSADVGDDAGEVVVTYYPLKDFLMRAGPLDYLLLLLLVSLLVVAPFAIANSKGTAPVERLPILCRLPLGLGNAAILVGVLCAATNKLNANLILEQIQTLSPAMYGRVEVEVLLPLVIGALAGLLGLASHGICVWRHEAPKK